MQAATKSKPRYCSGVVRHPDGRVWPCPIKTTMQGADGKPLCQKCQKAGGTVREEEETLPGQQKRGRGKPALPEGEVRQERRFRASEEVWRYCMAQPGGASAFLVKLVEAHREKPQLFS